MIAINSLEVLDEIGEGAAGFLRLLLEVEETRVLGRVGPPLGSEGEVVVHALVAEVKVLIAPVRSGERRFRHDLTDPEFSTTELGR